MICPDAVQAVAAGSRGGSDCRVLTFSWKTLDFLMGSL